MVAGDTARLFDGHDASDLERHEDFVVGRLLEEGDSDDLRRLAATVPEERWASWLEREGGRGLSDRSRVFWSLILSAESPDPPELRREIWPL